MKNFLKNYRSTLILIGSIIIGTIVGLIFKEKTSVLNPFGDLFLNMLLIVIVPLIFLTITTAIGKMKQPKRIGKILTTIVIVFILVFENDLSPISFNDDGNCIFVNCKHSLKQLFPILVIPSGILIVVIPVL